MSSSDCFYPKELQPPFLDTDALERLKDILGTEADILLPELLEDFFKDSTRMLANARSALEKKNAGNLRIAAHSLKSNSATYGAMALAAAAKELEELAREGILEGASVLIERSAREFEKIRPVLEQYCREL